MKMSVTGSQFIPTEIYNNIIKNTKISVQFQQFKVFSFNFTNLFLFVLKKKQELVLVFKYTHVKYAKRAKIIVVLPEISILRNTHF